VPDIKAAKDMNFWPFNRTTAALVAHSPLHAPHQPSDLSLSKLIMFTIRRRKPKARKPMASIVVLLVQVMGNFIPEIFQNLMFHSSTT
jgi:hypothetical protein